MLVGVVGDGEVQALREPGAALDHVAFLQQRGAYVVERVHLGDNTGEASSLHRKIVIDAVRLTRTDDGSATNPNPPPPANACPYASVDASTLNVRPQPNTTHAPVGTLDSASGL